MVVLRPCTKVCSKMWEAITCLSMSHVVQRQFIDVKCTCVHIIARELCTIYEHSSGVPRGGGERRGKKTGCEINHRRSSFTSVGRAQHLAFR